MAAACRGGMCASGGAAAGAPRGGAARAKQFQVFIRAWRMEGGHGAGGCEAQRLLCPMQYTC